jgi:hypothetical protein
MRYVDVFISHKKEDLDRARALKRLIKDWKFSCYIDGDDTELHADNTGPHEAPRPKALADRIRENLRTCRCLIFAYSARSKRSRWMPWELGFFDGRWGHKQIGLFSLDQIASDQEDGAMPDECADMTLSLQEYLDLYSGLTPVTLKSFIEAACSTRALSDRSDVDVDRLAALWAGAQRNPIEFGLGCMQYFVSLQSELWKALYASAPLGTKWPIPSNGQDGIDGLLRLLNQLREAARIFEVPRPAQVSIDTSVGSVRRATGGAIEGSVRP